MKLDLTRKLPWSQQPGFVIVLAVLLWLHLCCRVLSSTVIFHVREESKPGTIVGSLASYTTSFRNYNFEVQTDRWNYFAYGKSTGIINTTRAIDRDVLPGGCTGGSELGVLLFSSSNHGESQIRVKVFIDDINDNRPKFPSPAVKTEIPEDSPVGSSFRIPTTIATDSDCGLNGTVSRYSITKGNESGSFTLSLFIGRKSLSLVLLKELDREKVSVYLLNISACDGGSPALCSSFLLTVMIADYNDNKPLFHNVPSSVKVKERCISGRSILTLNVTDADSGMNARIKLSVKDTNNQLFEIDASSHELMTTKCLVYDKSDKSSHAYTLVIQAEDCGIPVQRNDVTIWIDVIDINDNRPVLNEFLQLPIKENEERKFVGIINVRDDDDGQNGNVTLEIVSGNYNSAFYLVRTAGNFFSLKFHGVLDREQYSQYNLTVRGFDHGQPQHSTNLTIVIPVADENDNPPICQVPTSELSISEAVPVGSFVTIVHAADKDEGKNGQIRFFLADQRNNDLFKIIESSGLVMTKGPLDCDTHSSVELRILVQDNGDSPLSSTCLIRLNITDVNDNKPLFTNATFNVAVPENIPVNFIILTLTAFDADRGDNSRLSFSMVFPSPLIQKTFHLNTTMGTLQILHPLDRETQDFFHLTVLVEDHGNPALYSTAKVNVTVLDINDNKPVFYPENYYSNIHVNHSNEFVVNANATDIDRGENGFVFYEIVENKLKNVTFNIDQNTGKVTANRRLLSQQSYVLKLMARDGQGAVSNISVLQITMLSDHDDLPHFEVESYIFSIEENVQSGTYVGCVKATRQSNSGTVVYILYNGDPDGIFSINDEGEIRTSKQVDSDRQRQFYLQVLAKTLGQRVLVGWTSVTVMVRDLNDNPPVFQYPLDVISVEDNIAVGSLIFRATAFDPDLDAGGLVKYELSHDSDKAFDIDSNTGDVTVAQKLSQLVNYTPVVKIMASDCGFPSLSSTLNLSVKIIKVNNNPPMFQSLPDMIPLNRDVDVEQTFFNVTALDPDGGINACVYFHLGNRDSDMDYFGIYSDGRLFVQRSLMLTNQATFSLQIIATDGGYPTLNSSAVVNISVMEKHGYDQFFKRKIFWFEIYENEQPGTLVGKLDIEDDAYYKGKNVAVTLFQNYADFIFSHENLEIRTRRVFDRESLAKSMSSCSQTLFAKATYNSKAGTVEDLATIVVKVKDKNDNRPVFSRDKYVVRVQENEKTGSVVLKLKISDEDKGENARVNFTIYGESLSGTFFVDEKGTVVLNRSLENKNLFHFNFTVQVTNVASPYFQSNCTVEIVVEDVNDNAPEFTKPYLTVSVKENFPLGQSVLQVVASDKDFGRNSRLGFTIVAGNIENTFNINHESGKMVLVRKLDFETEQSYMLTVRAVDSGVPPLSSTQTVILNVTDVNDNAPCFAKCNATVTVWENTAVGTAIGQCVAVDADSGINGLISYSILRERPRGNRFLIGNDNGTLYVNRPVDRELFQSIQIEVEAEDNAVPQTSRLRCIKTITINVQDVNDNYPRFTSPPAVAFNASAGTGDYLLTLSAIDSDAASNGRIAFRKESGKDALSFNLLNNGRLAFATKPGGKRVYHLIVIASDSGSPPLETRQEVTIFLVGGDGLSFVEQSYSVNIVENRPVGTFIVKVTAVAQPLGGVSQVKYFMTYDNSGGLLFLNSTTGDVFTRAHLDREGLQGHEINLVIYAVDISSKSARTTSVNVHVTILDENDNAPKFLKEDLVKDISEDIQNGSTILTLQARDDDKGKNGSVTFDIVGGNDEGFFTIDRKTGQIYLARLLDHEQRSSYILNVSASDEGLPQQSSWTTVVINVLDVNDNAPVFERMNYSFTVKENSPGGTLLGEMMANDLDTGDNGQVVYTLAGADSELFSVHNRNGILRTASVFDREKVAIYLVKVVASDRGKPLAMSSSAFVYISILDENDIAPTFKDTQPYEVTVQENSVIGTQFLSLDAEDKDFGLNSKLVYFISAGNSDRKFDISTSGTLSTAGALDRETKGQYNLEVTVSDSATTVTNRLTSTTRVQVNVSDVNDEIPYFLTQDVVHVREDQDLRKPFTTVIAADRDSGRNGEVEYELQGVMANTFFYIERYSGAMSLKRNLDREKLSSGSINVTVEARDRGKPPNFKRLDIRIILDDVNDNCPVFYPHIILKRVYENISIGSEIFKVEAVDVDQGRNGMVEYAITAGNVNHSFAVHPIDGIVMVVKPLDREVLADYKLDISAFDLGKPRKKNITTVRVQVLDVNDNSPQFLSHPAKTIVKENIPFVQKLASFAAVDNDEDMNGEITYAIVHAANYPFLYIDSRTGIVSLVSSLDRESHSNYSVVIEARDQGIPPLYMQTHFNIVVEDENDNSPVFVDLNLPASILEASPVGSKLCVMNATDADIGKNGEISYSLVSDFSRFRIDSRTGEIFSTAELDREVLGSQFKLVVKAQDGGNPARKTLGNIAGRIADIDDNRAIFKQNKYSAYIPANAAKGTFVTAVLATDKDEGLNGKVLYTVKDGSTHFYVESETGNILTKTVVPSSPAVFTLQIQAKNANTNLEDDKTTVVITVTRQNFPVFEIPIKVYNISEDVEPGHFILQAKATDDPTFQIASGNLEGHFSVDVVSGNLTLAKHLDYEQTRNYSLWIKASLNTHYSSYVNIHVFVVDVNDNKPVFEKGHYDVFVKESVKPNITVTRIIAEDYDSTLFGLVQFSIVEASARTWFRIGRYSGYIYTVRAIDRERHNSSFDLTVRAEDQGFPRNANRVSVHVNIVDVNDNPPVFAKVPVAYVLEDASPSLVLTTVFAEDKDESSRLSYSLAQNGNFGKTFAIQPHTGEIILTKTLDREVRAEYQLTVIVTDGRFFSNTSLTIVIKDVDDNVPKFLQSAYFAKIQELQSIGSTVIKLNISDDDIGPNADVVYSLKRTPTSDKFRIDSNGVITLASLFRFQKSNSGSFEKPNEYNVTVLAENPAHPFNTAETIVSIEILDANDHSPVFENNFYYAYIPSVSKKGTNILTLKATDVYDIGLNSEVSYRTVDGNGTSVFKVGLGTGYITVNSDLTSFVDKVFYLEVQAEDRGEPVRASETNAKVFITVTIENKHKPVFSRTNYVVEVVENYPVGKELLRVKASDSDRGVNGRVSYSVLPGNQGKYFNVDAHNGSVTIADVKLDYEYMTKYVFDIEAKDGAQNAKRAVTSVHVNVTDYNDNPPVFQPSSYQVNVLENSPVGTVVVVVSATDRDTIGKTVNYTLTGPDKDFFSINQHSGEITTKVVFDYELRTAYMPTVLAKDSGHPQKTSGCTVQVKVTSVNEFTPAFLEKEYSFSTQENAPVGTTIGRVSATDGDAGPDGVVQFVLVNPSGAKQNFDINQYNGDIFVSGRLDSETTDRVQLTVLAKNPGQIVDADNTDKANVVVKINDSNDPPRFLQAFEKNSVPEDIPVGCSVGNFSAVDDDTKTAFISPIKYSILRGNFNQSFLLETVDKRAIIRTAKPLDREQMAMFNLTLAAADGNDPRVFGIATLIVELQDINDNAPFLKQNICPGHVRENLPAGTTVLRLDAFDRDIDPNKDPYTFEIVNNEPVPFTVDKSTWELKTSTQLDREQVTSYSLNVKVTDSGYPEKSSVNTCVIIVDDVNDNLPSAQTRRVDVNIPAAGFSGAIIGDVSPVDADLVTSYTCEVEGNYKDVFSFLPSSCTLTTKKPQQAFYVLNVRARDELHQVSYSLNISFSKISDLTSQSSVILRLYGISPEQFLPVMNALPCESGYKKQIVSIERVNDTVTDVLMAHLKNDVYISKEDLSKILKQCKNDLQRQLTAQIIDTNYNLCSSSDRCFHGDCHPYVISLPQNRTTLYSKSVVFVSAYHKPAARCVCFPGYSGGKCEYSNKVCLSQPCKNGGACVPAGVGFICQCKPNYSGKFCESPVDLCDPSPCSNTSKCISTSEGPNCQCDFGGRGKLCERTSIGFRPTSYVKLSTIQSSSGKTFNNISMQLATVERNALILYNRHGADSGDSMFIALEIIEGFLRFSFDLGVGVVRVVSDNSVSDGLWHTVTAIRDKKDGHLHVDKKVFHSKNTKRSNETLELRNSPLYFGGVPSLDVVFSVPGQVSSYDFVGCLRDVFLNGVELDVNAAILKSGVISSCPRVSEKTCHVQRCHGNTACVDKWFVSLCQCRDENYAGERCDEKVEPLTLTSGSVLQFQFDPGYLRASEFLERQLTSQGRRRRDAESLQTFFMNVRSRNDDAFLWRAEDELGNYTQLQMLEGSVCLHIGKIRSQYEEESICIRFVNSGQWFNLTVTRDVTSNALKLSVNDHHNQTYPKRPYIFLKGTWTFGSVKYVNKSAPSFQGCISRIKINGEIISLSVTNQYGTLKILEGGAESGCKSPDFCASNPCPSKTSKCVNDWKAYTCVAARETSDALSVGAIAAIVFFCILVIAIVVVVIAVKKRRTRKELASDFSKKTNAAFEQDSSRESSSSESIPSRKTPSRHSLDSGVEINNMNASTSPGNQKKTSTSSASASVIPLGSPDEYTIVTSRRDSGSDQRDTGFTDSECEYGVMNHGANLTVSSIPSVLNPAVPGRKRQPRSARSPFNYNKKVPYLINRGYLMDTRRPSRSTTPTDEPESIELQNRSSDLENAEQYSIGNASLATYSDLNYSNNPTRSSDTDRMRYKPSLDRFSESEDSGDERQLSNIPDTFDVLGQPGSSGESSDGGFTASECDYEQRRSYDFDEDMPATSQLSSRAEISSSTENRKSPLPILNFNNYELESSVDDLRGSTQESPNWDEVLSLGVEYNTLRHSFQDIAESRDDDEDIEIV